MLLITMQAMLWMEWGYLAAMQGKLLMVFHMEGVLYTLTVLYRPLTGAMENLHSPKELSKDSLLEALVSKESIIFLMEASSLVIIQMALKLFSKKLNDFTTTIQLKNLSWTSENCPYLRFY